MGNRILGACVAFLVAAPWATAAQWSLHVGVDEYTNLPSQNLNGCVNDAELMRKTMIQNFGFPEANTLLLTNQDATGNGIVQQFEEFLVNQSAPGDTVVFTFSGHGHQIEDTDGDEEDGWDEFLCPSDLNGDENGNPVNVVTDDTLRMLCAKLEGRHLLIILDCCHSGTGTRGLFSAGKTRSLNAGALQKNGGDRTSTRSLLDVPEFDPSEQPRDTPTGFRDMVIAPKGDAMASGAHAGTQVFFSACKAEELAQEANFEVEGTTLKHGAFTTKFVQGVNELGRSPDTFTYARLKAFLEGPLITANASQHPQIEVPDIVLDSRVLYVAAAGDSPSPPPPAPPTPAPSAAAAEEAFIAVRPLRVYVASHESFVDGEKRSATPFQVELESVLRKKSDILKVVSSRDDSNVSVFYGRQDGGHTVGVLLHGGDVSKKVISVQRADESELKAIVQELVRLYNVNSLINLRDPNAKEHVSITLLGGGHTRKYEEPLAFRVESTRSGYLTVVGIDSQGGWQRVIPLDFFPGIERIEAGQPIEIKHEDMVVLDPFGEEFVKVLVTDNKLELPESMEGVEITETIATRAIGFRNKETKGLASLRPGNFIEGSLVFRTQP
jgi:hypothetical protein